MSKRLRILAACAALAGLGACAAPPPPAPVVTAPPPKPLDAKTQLENHGLSEPGPVKLRRLGIVIARALATKQSRDVRGPDVLWIASLRSR